MIDSTKSKLTEEIKYFSAAVIVTVQLAGSPSLAGNWQGLVQTGLNYAGRAATAAQRARAAHPSSDSGSQQTPSAEASVHADVIKSSPPPQPVAPTPVTPPPSAPSTESSSGNLHDRWFGNTRHAFSSTSPGVNSTTRSFQSSRPVQDVVPLSMQQARLNQLHNRTAKQKKPVVAHDASNNQVLLTDTNPAHRLTADNTDTPAHKATPAPTSTTIDTSFVDPVLKKILKQLKS
jgi:hypothetical protein